MTQLVRDYFLLDAAETHSLTRALGHNQELPRYYPSHQSI